MPNTLEICSDLEEIKEKASIPKIIVIGGGGLRKTTLVNNLTGSTFPISNTSEDGTFNFQGATIDSDGEKILIVDSPGYRLNEDRWWNGVMLIKNIIGVVIVHNYEERNSGYGNFGYVLAFLNGQQNTKVIKFSSDHSKNIERNNYMHGSVKIKHKEIASVASKVKSWIQKLDRSSIEITSPIRLIEQYKKSVEKVTQLEKQIEQVRSNHTEAISTYQIKIHDIKEETKRVTAEKKIAVKMHEALQNKLEELPGKLAHFDPHSQGYLSDSPGMLHHSFAWLPIAGNYYLRSLQKRANTDHQIALEIINMRKRRRQD
ncbi:hypothetical protein I4U23_015289 [Adineta vaga]|nr:hypothetical protein I4U23_015289 [Adineta vaga]